MVAVYEFAGKISISCDGKMNSMNKTVQYAWNQNNCFNIKSASRYSSSVAVISHFVLPLFALNESFSKNLNEMFSFNVQLALV